MTQSDHGKARRRTLTRETVLRMALAVVDEQGLEALTLRALGSRLGVSQTAVYRHVPDKAALMDGIAEQIWREALAGLRESVAMRDSDRRFRAFAVSYALNLRRTLLAHPNTALLIASHPISTLEQYELIAKTLNDVGILKQEASQPADMLGLIQGITVLTTGYVVAEVVVPVGGAGGEPSQELMRQAVEQSAALGSLLAPLFDAVHPWSFEQEYSRALNALLDGWNVA